jgi:DNA modification methylase
MKQQLKIYKVKGNPLNPRLIKNDKFKKLVNSIISIPAFMKLRPIILDEDFMVIGGNMRLKAHHHLNRKEIWTDMFTQADCDEMNKIALEEERETKTYLEYCNEITIKDNVSAGEWEYDMLANEWDSVQLNDFGLDLWQNEDDVKEGLIEDDEIPEVKESIVKRGDIWQLGEHRVMCGDSTSSDDVEKLMNGEKADMVFTDPPYGMNAVSKSGVLSARYKNDILGDDNTDVAKDSFSLIHSLYDCKQIWWGANYYSEFLPSAEGWIVWDKNNGGSDQTDCELAWTNFRSVCRLYKKASEKTNRVHPTQKPVELFLWSVEKFKVEFNIVLDVFLGSGSTLIAAEKLKRKCYGMELDEKYCDVIINRWEQFTGLKAEKIN